MRNCIQRARRLRTTGVDGPLRLSRCCWAVASMALSEGGTGVGSELTHLRWKVRFYFGGWTLFSLRPTVCVCEWHGKRLAVQQRKSLSRDLMKNHLGFVTWSQNGSREGAETALQVWGSHLPRLANEQLFTLYKVCQVYLADVNLNLGCSALLLMRPKCAFLLLVDEAPPSFLATGAPRGRWVCTGSGRGKGGAKCGVDQRRSLTLPEKPSRPLPTKGLVLSPCLKDNGVDEG